MFLLWLNAVKIFIYKACAVAFGGAPISDLNGNRLLEYNTVGDIEAQRN